MSLMQKEDFNHKNAEKYYEFMAKCIANERKRLGGDFAVAQAIPKKFSRDVIRKIAGPDLVFILLVLPKETILERLKKRHGEGEVSDEMTEQCFQISYEPKEENEENTFEVVITSDMSPEDVAEKIKMIIE